jgi:uncharacterized protein with HEPN domain
MSRDFHVVAGEILAAIEGIESAIAGMSFAQYTSDWTARRAVERGLEIVSEASRHLPTAWTDRHPEIPWPKVRSLGNVLRHQYHAVVDSVIWAVCSNDLPALKTAVEEMISGNSPK